MQSMRERNYNKQKHPHSHNTRLGGRNAGTHAVWQRPAAEHQASRVYYSDLS
jgi:hypothetical protein